MILLLIAAVLLDPDIVLSSQEEQGLEVLLHFDLVWISHWKVSFFLTQQTALLIILHESSLSHLTRLCCHGLCHPHLYNVPQGLSQPQKQGPGWLQRRQWHLATLP